LVEVLHGILAASVPKYLQLAHDIIHFFVTHDPKVERLISKEEGKRLIGELEGLLRKLSGAPDILAKALQSSDRHTLLWVCWRVDRIRDDRHLTGVPFDGWEDFAKTVVQAGRAAPRIIIPQILPFFVRRNHNLSHAEGFLSETLVFDSAAAERLFGLSHLAELFNLQVVVGTEFPADVAAEIQCAKDAMAQLPVGHSVT
jgi:hypothetical protein